MSKIAEYIYKDVSKGVLNVIQAKFSENSKIGFGIVIQTYHYGFEQVKNYDLSADEKSCLDCPMSANKNGGKLGKCYTHNGTQLMGIKSQLRSLQKKFDKIEEYSKSAFEKFITKATKKARIDLVRFGAYGEPIHLKFYVISELAKLGNHTGYTHQWKNPKYKFARAFFMASTHTQSEVALAKELGFRNYQSVQSFDEVAEGSVNCPASKEAGNKTTCIACKLCSGTKSKAKDMFILNH